MAAVSDKDKKRFLELTRMPYADQAKWFLNGFCRFLCTSLALLCVSV
jgi:hypothetical protein